MWKSLLLGLLCAVTVVVADVFVGSTLLRTFRPIIVSPPEGAILTPPVTVRWEGPPRLQATLVRSGMRRDLGLQENPFELAADAFAVDGQYEIEIRSPRLGGLVHADRRFHVHQPAPPSPAPAPEEAQPPDRPDDGAHDAISALQADRRRIEAEKAALERERATLQAENRDLAEEVADLRDSQEEADQRLLDAQAQQAALVEEHLRVLQENEVLRLRLQSVPTCTTWGYLSYPRPQTVSPTRRIVVVSDGRAQVFRSEAECVAVRRRDPTGASPCVCVGLVGSGPLLP